MTQWLKIFHEKSAVLLKYNSQIEIDSGTPCNTTYLPPPEGAGEFMACTMSVVRASNKLVMNSTFFPSGQPGPNQRQKYTKLPCTNNLSHYSTVKLKCLHITGTSMTHVTLLRKHAHLLQSYNILPNKQNVSDQWLTT